MPYICRKLCELCSKTATNKKLYFARQLTETSANGSLSLNSSMNAHASIALYFFILHALQHEDAMTSAETEPNYLRSGLQPETFGSAKTLRYVVPENVEVGTIIADIVNDAGLERKYKPEVRDLLEFRFVVSPPPPVNAAIAVDRKTGVVSVNGTLDRDAVASCRDRDSCELSLDVAISPSEYFTIFKMVVEIVDVNDNSPRFRQLTYAVDVRESTSIGSSFPLPTAVDADSRQYGVRRYQLVDPVSGVSDDLSHFAVTVASRPDGTLEPRLVIKRQLDHETQTEYQLRLIAIDGGIPALSAYTDVTVHVIDSNDHSPVFEKTLYTVTVAENVPVGTIIVRTHATDQDAGLNAAVVYKFSAQTDSLYGRLFQIRNETGEIAVRQPLDREQNPVIQLTVLAHDLGPDSLPSDVSVIVHVDDVNDNSPSIVVSTLPLSPPTAASPSAIVAAVGRRRTQVVVAAPEGGGGSGRSGRLNNPVAAASVQENLMPGVFVAYVSVSDPDNGENGRVDCDVTNDVMFTLRSRHNNEYQLVTAESLDRETARSHMLVITCYDHGMPSMTSYRSVTVNVTDVNDNQPVFTMASHTAHITENNYVGHIILQLSARDYDEGINAHFDFIVAGVSASFDDVTADVDRSSISAAARDFFHVNSRGVVSATRIFDREQYSHFRLLVVAVDRGEPAQTGSTTVDIFIDDANDERPMFVAFDGVTTTTSYLFRLIENEVAGGSLIGSVMARDLDASIINSRVQYAFLSTAGQTPARIWDSFVLDSDTGDIYVRSTLDREQQASYVVKITAFDSGRPTALSCVALVTIHVDDVNDNDPHFEFPLLPSNASVAISSRIPLGYPVTRVIAHDPDAGRNAAITYHMIQNGGEYFRIDPDSGIIFVNYLPTADDAEYQLVVVASDGGHISRSTSAALTIFVNSSLPFPLYAENGDARTSSNVFKLGVIATASVCFLLLIVALALVFIARKRRCDATGRNKQNQRLAALQMITAMDSEHLPELTQISPSKAIPRETTFETMNSTYDASSSYVDCHGNSYQPEVDGGRFDRWFNNDMTSFSSTTTTRRTDHVKKTDNANYSLPLTSIALRSSAINNDDVGECRHLPQFYPLPVSTIRSGNRNAVVFDVGNGAPCFDDCHVNGNGSASSPWLPITSSSTFGRRSRREIGCRDSGIMSSSISRIGATLPRTRQSVGVFQSSECGNDSVDSQCVWTRDPDVIRRPVT